MSRMRAVLNQFREWQEPHDGIGDNPFRLGCSFDAPAGPAEIADAWQGRTVPEELAKLWSVSRESRLFEDVDYGQWGLRLLSPAASAYRTGVERDARSTEYRSEDVVVGEFLGDQELLVLCPSEVGRRRVLIALPLDDRNDWYAVGSDLAETLEDYLEHRGDKFWEASQQS